MTPIEKLIQHLGFDPTKEVGTLTVFDRQTHQPFKTLSLVEIKEVYRVLDDRLKITLKIPNHRFYLEIILSTGLLLHISPGHGDYRATLTFPSGTLGSQP